MAVTTGPTGLVLGGRYRLLEALGSGASAHVFLAEDRLLCRRVAIKVLLPTRVGDESFLERFRSEALSVASLNHPHIMRVFDWCQDGDGPFLVLEYLGGGTLRQLLDRGVLLSPAQAARVGMQAAEGLGYAHARGVVHLDIKPANLIFDDEGRVRVADFGVARALADAASSGRRGEVFGTPRYVAPEQAQGWPVDGRADVYALALVLYEAVTGGVPFSADTAMGTVRARLGRPLPSHRALGPLEAVLLSAADPLDSSRPDALALALRLSDVAASLPLPEALPLAHAGGGPKPPAADPGDDGQGAAAEPPAQGASTVEARTAILPLSEGSVPVAPRAVTPRAGNPRAVTPRAGNPRAVTPRAGNPRRRSRGRILVWGLASLGLVMLLTTGAIYAVQEKVFAPSRPVPYLTGLTMTAADHLAHHDSLAISVASRRYSTAVPTGRVIGQVPRPRSLLKAGSIVYVIVSKGLPLEEVPSLLGLDCATAQRVLSAANLSGTCPASLARHSATVLGGQVITWSYQGKDQPSAAPWHGTIAMVVSSGPPQISVPEVAGLSYAQAAATLSSDGLTATERTQPALQPAGQVTATLPPAGQRVPQGSTVTVEVSSGLPQVQVPQGIVGLALNGAKAVLQAVGLNLGKVSGPAGGEVAAAQPASGTPVAKGSAVDVTMASAASPGASHGSRPVAATAATPRMATPTTGFPTVPATG